MRHLGEHSTVATGTRAASGAALLAVLLSSLLQSTPAHALPSDAWITTKVKLALVTSDGLLGSAVRDISIDTVNRQVTLHGTVSTAPEKEKAERAAKAVDGVHGVRNLLVVVAPNRQDEVQAKDDQISASVALGLGDEDSLGDSNISVQSVNKGVVLLMGTARTLTDHLTAVEIASNVPGVRRVASEVETPDTLADADMWREQPRPAGNVGKAPAPGHIENKVAVNAVRDPVTDESVNRNVNIDTSKGSATGAAGDLYTTSMVKMRLLANDETPALDINVDTHGGTVTLFGIVSDERAKTSAEAEARQVDGVTKVKNELQVVPAAKKEAVEARDDEIATNLRTSMGDHVALKNVEVDVKNCVARLSGSVPSGIERVEAMQVARATRGVCKVKNDLTITN